GRALREIAQIPAIRPKVLARSGLFSARSHDLRLKSSCGKWRPHSPHIVRRILVLCIAQRLYSPHGMRRMSPYIYDQPDWPKFHWNREHLAERLAAVRHEQGRLLGRMESM